jgi:hypothetical protein
MHPVSHATFTSLAEATPTPPHPERTALSIPVFGLGWDAESCEVQWLTATDLRQRITGETEPQA